MKPICVPCQRFYRPKKNGFAFVEGMPDGRLNGDPPVKPGTAEPHRWSPYKLWMGDLWECHGCGSEIIVGTGMNPVAEHFQKNFAERVQSFDAKLQVNDC